MGKLSKEFRDFAFKGNVVDMAVGVVVGGAFGKIVTSLVNDVIMPPIGVLLGGVDFSDLSVVLKPETVDAAGQAISAVTLNYGNFIKTIVDFLLVALSVFIFVKIISTARQKLEKKKKEEPAPAPAPPQPTKEEVLLTQIRDLLAENRKNS